MVDWIPSTWEESQHSNLRPSGPITVADSRYLSKSPRCRPSQPPSFITSIKSLKHTHFLLTYNKPCYLDLPYTTQAPPLIPHIPPTPQPPCLPFSKRTRTPEPNPFSRATVMTIEAMSFTFEPLNLWICVGRSQSRAWSHGRILSSSRAKEDRTTNYQILRPTPPKISVHARWQDRRMVGKCKKRRRQDSNLRSRRNKLSRLAR